MKCYLNTHIELLHALVHVHVLIPGNILHMYSTCTCKYSCINVGLVSSDVHVHIHGCIIKIINNYTKVKFQ